MISPAVSNSDVEYCTDMLDLIKMSIDQSSSLRLELPGLSPIQARFDSGQDRVERRSPAPDLATFIASTDMRELLKLQLLSLVQELNASDAARASQLCAQAGSSLAPFVCTASDLHDKEAGFALCPSSFPSWRLSRILPRVLQLTSATFQDL